MKVQSRRFGTHRVIGKYVAVIALMASGLTVGLAGVAAADNVPTTSTVGASPLVVPANGVTTSTITVTLGTNAGATDMVSLAGVNANSSKINGGAAGASASIAAVAKVATFTVTDTVGQAVTYQATDTTDLGEVVIQTATVTFEGTVALSPVAGSYNTSAFAAYTVAPEGAGTTPLTLAHVGDVLVIWIEEDPQTGSSHVTGITNDPSSTGTIGTPVEAIQYAGVNVTSDVEVWYAPVTAVGTALLDYTWSGTIGSTSREQYTTEEFQPASAATYSTGTTNTVENAASNTIAFPALTSLAGELYAGSIVNFAQDANAPTGTTSGYTANVEALEDLAIFDADTSAGVQSPTTTVDYATPETQSGVAATIYPASTAFTVNFNNNGGTGTMASETDSAATALTSNTFTRTGFTFSGWNTVANGSGTAYANDASYPFSASTTLFAQWTANTSFTVTFNNNGGTGTMANETDSAPTALTTNTFTRTGYTFDGWNTAAGGGGTAYADGATYPFTASVTLYAQWATTVTFNNNGGTGTMANEVETAATPLTTNTFTRTGYTFSGWNTVALGGGTAYADGASYPFTASVTLYAQWTANAEETVTFNANGGTGTMANETDNSPTALTTNTFTRTGYTFSGWNTVAGGGGTAYADGATYPFTASATLYAQWTANASFTVTFNDNGGTGTMANEVDNSPTALTTNTFTRTGYTFTGWNTVAGGGGTAYANGATYPFTANVTLYAQWTLNANETVTFNANGGTGTMANETENTPTALTTNTFTRTGYNFEGWNTIAGGSGTEYANGATYPFTASATLYAQWAAVGSGGGGGGGGGGGTTVILTVTATGGTVGYGTAFTPASTVNEGLLTGDTATVSTATYTYTGTGTTTYAASTTAPTAVGTYNVAPSAATVVVAPATDASKYSTTYNYVGGALTITPGALTVTAGNVSITAGGTVTPTATVTGLGGTDTATVTTATFTFAGTGSTTYAASSTAPTAPGTYSITPTAATLAVSPAADAADYSTTYTYVAGTLTITAKPKPPVVLHASHITGSILPGRHSITITGTGFSGSPKITGTTKGIKVQVSKDSGTRLTVWVTVPKGTKAGHGTFTIRLANGKTCKITYTIK